MKKVDVPATRYIELVKEYYPLAQCILRPFGKEYYYIEVIDNKPSSIIGQGKTEREAWIAAYRYSRAD